MATPVLRLASTKHTLLAFAALATGTLFATPGECAVLTQFRIINRTAAEVSVTSAHTKKTVQIPSQQAVFVPHSRGDITVTLPGGKTWVYKDLSPQALLGTPFLAKKQYLFFGFQDGYIFRASLTVTLLLNKDGRLYVVPPDAKDVDVDKLREPKGFPVRPEEGNSSPKSAPKAAPLQANPNTRRSTGD
jgi:hypothetical protein